MPPKDSATLAHARATTDSEHRIKLRGSFDGSKARGIVEGGPNCVYKEKWTARKR